MSDNDLRQHAATLERKVAERRRAEAALRENEARTQFAMTAARMGVWEADLGSGRLTWSDSLALVFGLDPASKPSTLEEFFELIHPDDRPGLKDGFDRAGRDGTDLVNEFRTVWPDGTEHWIEGHARRLTDERGGAIKMTGVGMDISERKSLEQQLRQAQRMEAIGQLAGGVAHDFNNLLTTIHGYAELVHETLIDADQRKSDIEEILKATTRATSLTRQSLAFSRKQVLQPTLFDLNTLVTDTSTMLRRLIGEDVELVTTLAPQRTLVRADAGQLEQILMNLAVNARDAMPRGGRLSIETANVELDDSYAMHHVVVRPGPYVLLAVGDTGVGMDAATRQRIFEPFFTTKEIGRGTGLGLATVYGIVKQSGGFIWVYSEPDKGTTFKVYLPRAEEAEIAKERSHDRRPPSAGSETVLLVEDEQALRRLTRQLLERAGYRVFDAADPAAAEAIFRERGASIELLLTDVVMPGSSGPSLFARLSAERPALRVLYISGYMDDAVAHHAGLSPQAAFLQKPFTTAALMSNVREVLDR